MTTLTPAIEAPRGKRGRPQLRLNDDALTLWTERVVTKLEDVAWEDRRRTHNSIVLDGDTVYHYGHHFALATIIRKPNGRARLVLFNGDRYTGPSGWGHSTWSVQMTVQRKVRDQIEQSGLNIETVTIPFSALDAAGIDKTSVRPLHVMDDRTETEDFESRERPGDLKKMNDPSGATYVHTEVCTGYTNPEGVPVDGYSMSLAEREAQGVAWRQYTKVEDRPVKVDDPKHCEVDVTSAGWAREGAELGDDGVWRWTVETHKLGEALFTARYTAHSRRPATTEEIAAHLDLDAWSEEYRRAGYPPEAMYYKVGLRPRPDGPDVEMFNRGSRTEPAWWVRVTKRRVEKFLSSYDYAEPHRPYFMCELPHACAARTIPEALEALKPADVAQAEGAGVIGILRQGDIFAIPTDWTERELTARAVTVERSFWRNGEFERELVAVRKIGQDGYPAGAKDIHGSTHQVTHLIVGRNGEMYGRGRMYHRPSGFGRTSEHRTLDLGDRQTWYRLVRNTVPTDPQTGGIRSAGGIQQSGNARAWMLGGDVD